MRILIAATVALAGCASAPAPSDPETPGASAGAGNDCAVIAAVAKEHFRFGPDNVPPPVKFEDGFNPRCDWSRYGLAFQPYVERPGADPRETMKWVSFDRPRYDSQGALIAVGIMHGPLAGIGSECRVRSGVAGWMVAQGDCRSTWVS